MALKKVFLLFLISCLILPSSIALAQTKFTISGYIHDAATGEVLIGAGVFDRKSQQGSFSNEYGYYSITLNEGDIFLIATYLGYQSFNDTISLYSDKSINIMLESGIQLQEVVVQGDESEGRIEERTQMSAIEMPMDQLKSLPSLLGETDVLRALQLLPGVSGGGEGGTGLFVRGGSPDQNLILLDGVPVYNASHLFGFFSVFNLQ